MFISLVVDCFISYDCEFVAEISQILQFLRKKEKETETGMYLMHFGKKCEI